MSLTDDDDVKSKVSIEDNGSACEKPILEHNEDDQDDEKSIVNADRATTKPKVNKPKPINPALRKKLDNDLTRKIDNDLKGSDNDLFNSCNSFYAGVEQFESMPSQLQSIAKEMASKVSVFSGENFQTWRRMVEKVMVIYGLHDHIQFEGDYTDREWIRNDAFVAGYLEAHLSDSLKLELDFGDGSAYALWQGLLTWYGDRDQKEKFKAFRDLRFLRLDGPIDAYSKKFLGVVKQLQRFSIKVDNELLCYYYLDGLGDRGTRMRDKFMLEQMPLNRLVSNVVQLFQSKPPDINFNHSKSKQNRQINKQKTADQGDFQATATLPYKTNDNRSKKFNKPNNTATRPSEDPVQFNLSQSALCKVCQKPQYMCTHGVAINSILYARSGARHSGGLKDTKQFDPTLECAKGFSAAQDLESRSLSVQDNSESTPTDYHNKQKCSVALLNGSWSYPNAIIFNEPRSVPCPTCGDCFADCRHSDGLTVNVLVNSMIEWLVDVWLFDTGSSVNICNNLKWFTNYKKCVKEFSLSSGTDKLVSEAVGTIKITLKDRKKVLVIADVFYCPKAAVNLVTNIAMAPNLCFYGNSKKIHIWFDDRKDLFLFSEVTERQNRLVIQPPQSAEVNVMTRSQVKSQVVVPATNPNKRRVTEQSAEMLATSPPELPAQFTDNDLDFNPNESFDNEFEGDTQEQDALDREDLRHELNSRTDRANPQDMARSNKSRNKFHDFNEVHRGTGHWDYATTVKLATEHGVKITPEREFECMICSKNNLRMWIDHHPADRAWILAPNMLLHMDVCGKFKEPGFDGSLYFITSVEDYTGYVMVKPIAEKSQVFDYFVGLKNFLNNWFGSPLKVLRTDKGGEFRNKNFEKLEHDTGLTHEWSSPYIHFENGKAERAHHTIHTAASKILEDSGLDERFWPEAVRCAAYLFNRRPSFSSSNNLRFYNRYDDRKIIRFGARIVYYDHRYHPNTIIKQHGREGLFMGYNLKSKDYRVWDTLEDKLVEQAFEVNTLNRFRP